MADVDKMRFVVFWIECLVQFIRVCDPVPHELLHDFFFNVQLQLSLYYCQLFYMIVAINLAVGEEISNDLFESIVLFKVRVVEYENMLS